MVENTKSKISTSNCYNKYTHNVDKSNNWKKEYNN